MEKLAVGYIRVSDPKQIENNSLETQQKEITRHAASKGYKLIKIFREEGKSAKHIYTRPELRKLFEYCENKKNKISAVFVYKSDRFSRNVEEGLAAISRLARYGVQIVSVIEGYENDAMGRAMRTIVMAVDQLDNEVKGERVKDNMQTVFKKGLWPFKPPIGYKRRYRAKEDNKGIPPIPHPNLAPIVKEMFINAATGIYSKSQLARIMNLAGFKDYYKLEADHKIINNMLRKSFYYGYMYAPKWNEYAWGQHKPLIDELTWRKAYDKVILKKKNHSYQDDTLYPLKGLLKCDKCSEVMTTCPSQGRHGKVYYYECKNRQCRKLRINSKKAHKQFMEILNKVKPTKRVIKLFNHMVFAEWDKVINQAKDASEIIDDKIVNLKKELASIRKAKDDGLYTIAEAKEQAEEIRQEITVLEIERSDCKLEQYDAEIVRSFTENFLMNIEKLWEALDFVKKQELQRKIFVGGIICESLDKIRTAQLSPSFELVEALAAKKGKNVHPEGFEPPAP